MKFKGYEVSQKTIALFWSHVQKSENGCWEWTAYRNKKGYGYLGFGIGKKKTLQVIVHRLSYTIEHGEEPKECVLHRCDNPACVRPDHLFLGTREENNLDMVAKGRHGSKLHPEQWKRNRPRADKHARAKLSWDQVREMRRLYATGAYTYQMLSDQFSMSMSQIANIIRGAQWIEPDSVST